MAPPSNHSLRHTEYWYRAPAAAQPDLGDTCGVTEDSLNEEVFVVISQGPAVDVHQFSDRVEVRLDAMGRLVEVKILTGDL